VAPLNAGVADRPKRWRLVVGADIVFGLAREAKILLLELYRMIFSDAAISMKSRLLETLQHMVVGGPRAELRGEPLSV
jgi:hypothetical protein